MASHSKRTRAFDPSDPVRGYRWISLLREKIQHGLTTEGRGSMCLEGFLRAYFAFSQWDGWLMRARLGALYSVEAEMIERAGVDPHSIVQIEQRHRRAWERREAALQSLFPDGTPGWMVPLLDWPAQMRITDGY